MAKKLNKNAEASKAIDADELKRIVAEHNRQTANAAEYNGRAGQAIKTACERYNLNRKALRAVLGLSKAEATKQLDYLRSFIEYAYKMEMFDQVDAFDDLKPLLRTILEEMEERGATPRASDPIVSSLVN